MQEDKQDTNRTDVLHQEEIDVEETRHPQCTIIRKLIMYQFVRHKPTNQDTCQEAHNGQEDLSRHEIEDIKQRFAQDMHELSRRS